MTLMNNFLPFTNYDESIKPFKIMVQDYLDGVSAKYGIKETKIKTRYYKKTGSTKIEVHLRRHNDKSFKILTFGMFSNPLKESDLFR